MTRHKWEPVRPRPEVAAEALARYGHDLTELARQGTFAPLERRGAEAERVFQVLARRHKNNPVLIGEPEGDRLPIAREVVRRIARGEVPDGSGCEESSRLTPAPWLSTARGEASSKIASRLCLRPCAFYGASLRCLWRMCLSWWARGSSACD